jgi:competence ComEA-like helix-hairpin-helix protein
MKLPFFKSSKPEPKPEPKPPAKVLVVPPRLASSAPAEPSQSQPSFASATAVATPKPAMPESKVSSIPLCLDSILAQLPPTIFVVNDKAQLASITIALPANVVLPQLVQGRIEIPLADLYSLLPKDVVRSQFPSNFANQKVVLPLAEVIAATPPEALASQHEAVIAVDTPEFDRLPKLFDDSLMQEPEVAESDDESVPEELFVEENAPSTTPAAVATSAPATAPTSRPATAPTSGPATVPTSAVNAEAPSDAPPAHPALVSDVPDHVKVSLRSLVSVMPDNVFACPRSELWRKGDFDLTVLLPVEPMLSQLSSARVRLPLATVIEVIPPTLLANPLPETGDETVPIPLGEIVTQLPPRLFTNGLSDAEPQQVEVPEEAIPDPFGEKTPAPITAEEPSAPVGDEQVETAVQPQAQEEPIVEPQAQEESTVEPQVEESIEDAVVETEPLNDEGFAVFAEKAPMEPQEPIAEARAEITQPPPVAATPEPPEHLKAPEQPVVPTEPVPAAPETTQECVTDVKGLGEQRFLVDLNRCTSEDLQQIEGIGPSLARRIIEFRNARGQFRSINELRHIPGIGRKTFRALAGVEPRALNRLLGAPHNDELTLQEIVRLTGKMPGVEGCMLAMSDGIFLTGQLPERLDQNTVSVFAPQLFKRVGRYMRELRVGQIRRMTIFTDQQPLSIFRAGDVYLIIVHDVTHFSKALLRRCERISEEIARLCRQRAVV